jgi:hypothetical protein
MLHLILVSPEAGFYLIGITKETAAGSIGLSGLAGLGRRLGGDGGQPYEG